MRARFRTGDSVTVVNLDKSGHVRTPSYVRSKTGKILELCGFYLNPEDLSVGNTGGPAVPLYRILFRQVDLWPDYDGQSQDTLAIEIYDHWLVQESMPIKAKRAS